MGAVARLRLLLLLSWVNWIRHLQKYDQNQPTRTPMTSATNKSAFQDPGVVKYYGSDSALQPPEQRILEMLRPQLAEMSMLDIGVGTGRTTRFFAPLVKTYVGVDYAPAMVDECRARFDAENGSIQFSTADVRDLSEFADHSFDLVMFSYNGLDYIAHEERLVALREMARVARRGGIFVFSTHNLLALPALFARRDGLWRSPILALRHFVFQFRLRRQIPAGRLDALMSAPWAIVNDGAHDFRVETYYIRPSEQLRQLEAMFTDIVVFRLLANGEPLEHLSTIDTYRDPWVYFLCSVR